MSKPLSFWGANFHFFALKNMILIHAEEFRELPKFYKKKTKKNKIQISTFLQ
jgi:hypothetical protein